MESISNDRLISALKEVWSLESCTKCKKDNPALGAMRCNGISCSRLSGWQDFKTRVVKPETEAIWHFYNLINDKHIDFTSSPFDESIKYAHHSPNRDEAVANTNSQHYGSLKSAVERYLQPA